MNPKTRACALAISAAVGCTPTQTQLRRDALLPQLAPGGALAGAQGQVLAPKRCDLKLAVLSRPVHDAAINEAAWRVADEQMLAPEVRRVLEANGLRVGLIAGGLPRELEDLLAAPPPHQVEPAIVSISSGENTLFCVSPATPKVSLILNRDDRTVGKDYSDASGMIRVTASHDDGQGGVALRLVPELHHGPIQHRFAADTSNNSPFSVNQFIMKDGQQEETLRELASTLTLQPGQVAVIGCRPERQRSLGYFLFTEAEANSDRLLQKVMLVWATRGRVGEVTLKAEPAVAAATGPQQADADKGRGRSK